MGVFLFGGIARVQCRCMDDALGKLFGSPARVKLLRLFLLNPETTYTASDAALRARVTSAVARKELAMYERVGLLRPRRAKGGKGWSVDTTFVYLSPLKKLLLNLPVQSIDIVQRLRAAGVIKLLLLSGVFIDGESTIDVFAVGDKLDDKKMKTAISLIEAELGKELRYVALPVSEFMYRLDVHDKLVRDILDYPHTVAINKLNIPLE